MICTSAEGGHSERSKFILKKKKKKKLNGRGPSDRLVLCFRKYSDDKVVTHEKWT